MFFRVEDPLEMDCARFFRHVARLPIRDGAVRQALAIAEHPAQHSLAPAPEPAVQQGDEEHIAAIAAMTQYPGFPSVGYSGAG